jgi:acyl-CoA hydrolase
MDIAAYLSAAKHCNSGAMTASVDNISFKTPIKLGNVICIEAKVTRAFTTSMEIHLKVWNQNTIEQTRVLSNEAYFTFVALDAQKQPKKVPAIIAETEEEKKYYASALRRRQLRLILAGKMKPDDATELKALFIKEEGE